jgi:hypothetical protein
MPSTLRTVILRANAFYIALAGAAGLVFDIRGVLTGLGPQGRVLAEAPHAAIGFVEAHGLAVILAVLLWRLGSTRPSHVAALCLDALLGTSNLAFWSLFVATDALLVGYVSTTLHVTFAVLQGVVLLTTRSGYGQLPIPNSQFPGAQLPR